MNESPSPGAVEYENAPLRPFHVRTAIASGGGVFSDGFALGIVGIALTTAGPQLNLTPVWLGLIGGGSLAGLFAGALIMGPLADRFGRRPIFAYNMVLIAACSIAQYFAQTAEHLLGLRLVIGFLLGSDYVVSKALLSELSPHRLRGTILSTLAIAWAAGYVCAYVVGFALRESGPDAWRWMLVSAALPAALVIPFRITTPESPLWLARQGQADKAARIVRETLGDSVLPPRAISPQCGKKIRWTELWSPQWRRHTFVGCVFYTCQVIPYFALGTFVPRVMAALEVPSGPAGGLIYNLFLLGGGIAGLVVMDRIPRRQFLVWSFAITAIAMFALSLPVQWSSAAVIAWFALFACVLSAAANLEYIYVAELFPTELRASGIGQAIAASRIGSATSTFLLPVVVANWGVHIALAACVAVLAFGGVVCQLWAPETRDSSLGAVAVSTKAPAEERVGGAPLEPEDSPRKVAVHQRPRP